jgi:hypothetical protein
MSFQNLENFVALNLYLVKPENVFLVKLQLVQILIYFDDTKKHKKKIF